MSEDNLEIIYQNDDLIAINKPHGLLVHRTKMALDATEFAVQRLRNQIGQRVFPCHRLDRKTSGVLLFAKNEIANQKMQAKFRECEVEKLYHAIVRGYLHESDQIDYALTNEGKTKEAITHYRPIKRYEILLENGKFKTARYTLVELIPKTGRFHQLRKHMAHIMHPILGDRPHGCNKQNKIWKERFSMMTMMLHATTLSFIWSGEEIVIGASQSKEFNRVIKILDPEV